MVIVIRKLRVSDKVRIAEIGNQIFRAEDELPLLQKALFQCIPKLSLVAVEDKKVIGFTLVCKKITKEYYQFLSKIPNCYELAFLGISQSHQGQGLGSRLLKEVLISIFEHSSNFTCWLLVDKTNYAAIRLYDKFGFRRWIETKKGSILIPGYIMGLSYRRYRPKLSMKNL